MARVIADAQIHEHPLVYVKIHLHFFNRRIVYRMCRSSNGLQHQGQKSHQIFRIR